MSMLADYHFRQVGLISVYFHIFKSETKNELFTGVVVASKMIFMIL